MSKYLEQTFEQTLKVMTEIQAVSGEQTLKDFLSEQMYKSVRNFRNYDFITTQLFNILEAFQKLFLAIIFGVRIFKCLKC